MKKSFGTCGILIAILFGCKSSTEPPAKINTEFEDSLTLTLADSISFPIDSLTSLYTTALQYYEDKETNTKWFALLNLSQNSIYLYDYTSRNLHKVIKYETEGPIGVDQIEGFKIHNFDSIIVNSRYKLALTDTSAKPFYKFDFWAKRKSEYTTALLANETKRPAQIINNELYIDALPDIQFNDLDAIEASHVKYILNLKSQDYRMDFKYPSTYYSDVYGIHYLMFYGTTYNKKTKRFIYSFPPYYNVIETDHKGLIEEYYAGAECCNDVPYMKIKNPSKKEYHQHFFTNPSYDAIIYDEYRDLYYRIVMTPLSIENFNERKWERDFIIVILDSNFVKVGEVVFKKEQHLDNSMWFVTESGLSIHKSNGNEDNLTFYTFKPEKK